MIANKYPIKIDLIVGLTVVRYQCVFKFDLKQSQLLSCMQFSSVLCMSLFCMWFLSIIPQQTSLPSMW
jgi:hypothetical protein